MIAGRLTHRARVERNVAAAKDAWGNPVAPDFQELYSALKCFAWSTSSREQVDGTKTAMFEDARMMIFLGADLREGDVITRIEKRNGDLVMDGRLKVEGPIQHKHTHGEAAIQRIS